MKRCETCPRQLPPPVDIRKRFCGVCLAERERIQNRESAKRHPEVHKAKLIRQRAWARAKGVRPRADVLAERTQEMFERERKASVLIAEGLSVRAVARKLGVSVGTIVGLTYRVRKHMEQQGA
jgi:DNA-binding NarL/FixJ family response regulator